MIRTRIKLLFLIIFFFLTIAVFAKDYGFIINQSNGFSGIADNNKFENVTAVIPYFSSLLGNNGYFFASGGLIFEYENENFSIVPEILSTYLLWHIYMVDVTFGRVNYIDPLGFIAAGLFDGVKLSVNTPVGTFYTNSLFSGLLYKKRNNIAMTSSEVQLYSEKLSILDFSNTYFSPNRFLNTIEWNHTDFLGFLNTKAAVILQFDLSDEFGLNSQYFIAGASMPYKIFNFYLGLCLEFIQDGNTNSAATAADIKVNLLLPTVINDNLSFSYRFSTSSFLPVSTLPMGNILQLNISGISMLSADYNVLLHRTFFAGIRSTYFIRNMTENYNGYPTTEENGGLLLGNEFYGYLEWRPFSDLQFNLGGGVFLPALGNASIKNDPMWCLDLNIIFSF